MYCCDDCAEAEANRRHMAYEICGIQNALKPSGRDALTARLLITAPKSIYSER
jgi:hypothetical protein